MIGRPRRQITASAVPKWSLWRWVARAQGQVLACLAHRDTRPAGGRADVGDRREQGILPQVAGLPPGDLLKQVRFSPAVKGCCGQHRVLELLVLPAAERALGQEPLAESLQRQRVGPADPASVQRVRGDVKEHLAGEGVIPRVQGRKLAHQLEDVSVAGEPVEQDTAGGHGVLGGGPLPGRHITTVGQNHRSPGGLTTWCAIVG